MEASALQAPASLPQTGVAMAAPLLRFRSDEQLVALFRAGHDDAFRAIHDRYHKRLFAYTRQMLHGRQDAEDALQDVFVRAYSGLRASDQQLALRAWLFRVAHNRCIDELRRPGPPPPEVLELVRATVHDPLVEVDLRESLRRLIEDIRRLPEQQRSALLMRELVGMSYADLSVSLGISIGAVKSLLVRARVALAQAAEARDTSCFVVREQLVEAHDRGIRPNANTRKHMRDCVGCKSFRRELRGMSRQLAAVSPAVGPLGILAKTLGFSGGAGGGAAGGGGLALLGGGGATASAGGLAVGINHVATLIVAAAATAGGAAAIQHTIIAPPHHAAHARPSPPRSPQATDALHLRSSATGIQAIARAVEATVSTAPKLAAAGAPASRAVKARLYDPLGGGPVHAPVTGAARLTQSSRSKASGTSPGAAGLQDGSSSASSSAACSQPIAADESSSSSSTTSTSAGSSTASSAPASPGTLATQAPCIAPPAPSTGATSTSTTSSGSAGSGSQTAGSTTNSSSPTSSSSSTSTSEPASSPSSQSTSSGGGSASASK
jgi:RNA polymerase sigma factor (sigma-70 family)